MVFLIPILGLFAGILLGSIISIQIPLVMAKYLSIAVLAALDSVLGFISNALLAAFLAFLGDQLSVDLYMAAVFVFGVRIFNNLSTIRHYILNKFLKKHNMHAVQHYE